MKATGESPIKQVQTYENSSASSESVSNRLSGTVEDGYPSVALHRSQRKMDSNPAAASKGKILIAR